MKHLFPLVLALALLTTGCTVPAAERTTEPAEPTTLSTESATIEPITEPTASVEPTTPTETVTAEPTIAAETLPPLAPDTTRAVEPEPVAVSAYSGELPEDVRQLPIFEREYAFGTDFYKNPFWQGQEDRTDPDDFIVAISNAEGLSLRVKSPATGDQADRAFYEVTDIYYKGMAVHCSTPLGYYAIGFGAWRSGNLIVLGNAEWVDAVGRYYFLTDRGAEYIESHYTTHGCDISFSQSEDGSINYYKLSAAYRTADQALDYMVDAYVSDDQFYSEKGAVGITKNGLRLTKTEYYTINDWYANFYHKYYARGNNNEDYGAKTMGEFVERYKQAHGRG